MNNRKLKRLLSHFKIDESDLEEAEIEELLSYSAKEAEQYLKVKATFIKSTINKKVRAIINKPLSKISNKDLLFVCNKCERGDFYRLSSHLLDSCNGLSDIINKLKILNRVMGLEIREVIEKDWGDPSQFKEYIKALEHGEIDLKEFLRNVGVKDFSKISNKHKTLQ